MKSLTMEGVLRVAALAACAMVAGMFALFLATGIGQDPLQFVHPPQEYVDLLRRGPCNTWLQPGGSVKDRAAKQIVLHALRSGALGGGTFVRTSRFLKRQSPRVH